jgi:hypothetical protein
MGWPSCQMASPPMSPTGLRGKYALSRFAPKAGIRRRRHIDLKPGQAAGRRLGSQPIGPPTLRPPPRRIYKQLSGLCALAGRTQPEFERGRRQVSRARGKWVAGGAGLGGNGLSAAGSRGGPRDACGNCPANSPDPTPGAVVPCAHSTSGSWRMLTRARPA